MHKRTEIADLFDQYAEVLFGYLRHMGLGEADAYDVLQTSFLRFMESAPPDLQSPKAWLYTVARRAAIDKLRRRIEAPLPDDEGPAFCDESSDALGLLLCDERNAELWRAFRSLGSEDQELLRLHILDSLDYGELANVLGRSQGALRVAVFRARARLRQAYTPLAPKLAGEVLA